MRDVERRGNSRQSTTAALTLSNMVLCCLLSSVIVSYIGLINLSACLRRILIRLVAGNNHVYLPGSAMADALILLPG